MAHGGIHAQPGAEKGFLHAESFSPTPSPAEQHGPVFFEQEDENDHGNKDH